MNELLLEIPTEKMAVLSTAHLPKEAFDVIKDALNRDILLGMTRNEGVLLYMQQPDPYAHSDCSEYSEELIPYYYLAGLLMGNGYLWVLFDRDAEIVDGLNTYNW